MLLSVENLATTFFLDEGELRAVDDVSFTLEEGETVTLVGESGCGKTIVALSIINLVPAPGRIVQGRVLLEGEDLLQTTRERLREIRGRKIGFVFQEPGAALNPVFTIGNQIGEVLRAHRGMLKHEAQAQVIRLLGDTGIPEPEKRAKAYPFELSGGMRQRVALLRALLPDNPVLLLDEPFGALDAITRSGLQQWLLNVLDRSAKAVLLVTHDVEAMTVVGGVPARLIRRRGKPGPVQV